MPGQYDGFTGEEGEKVQELRVRFFGAFSAVGASP